MKRSLKLLLVCFLLAGCAQHMRVPVSILKFDVARFESQADRIVQLSEDNVAVSINLYELPQIVQFNFPASRDAELLGIRLIENDRVNINRHLLFNREYGIDDEGVLKVQVKAPYIYFLDGQIRYRIVLLYYDRARHAINKQSKLISLNWRPMVESSDTPLSFRYHSPEEIAKGRGIDVPSLAREAELSKLERFHPDYAQKVRAIAD